MCVVSYVLAPTVMPNNHWVVWCGTQCMQRQTLMSLLYMAVDLKRHAICWPLLPAPACVCLGLARNHCCSRCWGQCVQGCLARACWRAAPLAPRRPLPAQPPHHQAQRPQPHRRRAQGGASSHSSCWRTASYSHWRRLGTVLLPAHVCRPTKLLQVVVTQCQPQ